MFQKEEQILKNMRDGINILTLSCEIKTVYSYTYKIVKKMQKEGYLTIDKVRRDNILKLTERGRKIRKKLLEIDRI